MTADEKIDLLTRALAALRTGGVAQAVVKLDSMELSVVFQPDIPPEPALGDEPTPGGWKTPLRLDEPFNPSDQ